MVFIVDEGSEFEAWRCVDLFTATDTVTTSEWSYLIILQIWPRLLL